MDFFSQRLTVSCVRERSNNSFKPKLLRSGNGVAEKASHAVPCATQFGLTQVLGPGKSFPVLWASVVASRSAFLASCWVAVGRWFARRFSRFGCVASDSAGAPPPSAGIDLRVRARMLLRLAVLAVARSLTSVFASAGRRVRFGLTGLGLRVARLRSMAPASCAALLLAVPALRP